MIIDFPPEERAFPDFNCHRVQDGQWRLLREDWEQWFTGPNSLSSMVENCVKGSFGGCLLRDLFASFPLGNPWKRANL